MSKNDAFSALPIRTETQLPASSGEEPACRLTAALPNTSGEVRCPVCHFLVPPEHIGYKLHCRRCGYLESCCNPH